MAFSFGSRRNSTHLFDCVVLIDFDSDNDEQLLTSPEGMLSIVLVVVALGLRELRDLYFVGLSDIDDALRLPVILNFGFF